MVIKMRNIRKLQFWEKWKNKLAVWLGLLIFTVNLLVLLLSFAFQYGSVRDILLEKDEEDNIERFEQSEYNIHSFCEQVDLVLRMLSIDFNMQKLSVSGQMSDDDLFYYAKQVVTNFKEMQAYYPYIQAISYYGADGLVLKNVKGANYGNYFLKNQENIDWYYSSEIYDSISGNKQKLKWFGGYMDSDFGWNYKEEDTHKYYISAARNVISGSGTLVLNIEMEYFLDIFYANRTPSSGNIYIVDENNRVIATKDVNTMGMERKYSERERIYEGIDKCVEDNEQGTFQVIIYSLPELGWSFISETPISEVTKVNRYLRNIMLFSCLLSVAVSFGLSTWWVSKMLNPLNRLVKVMQKVGDGQLGYVLKSPPKNELGVVAKQFNQMSVDLKEIFEQKERMEKEKRNLELQTLRSQINPHLIYNTLNNIKWMAIISDERNIAESITLLSDFLEPVFKNKNLMCTIGEELDYVKKYIAIMNLRGTEGYSLELAIPEEYYNYQIIRFLLQPVVENSILHGLAEKDFGRIRISMWIEDGDGVIQVEDNGSGIEEGQLQELQRKIEGREPQEGKGIGMVNVNHRIKAKYGEGYALTIGNGKEKGTIVTLRMKLET